VVVVGGTAVALGVGASGAKVAVDAAAPPSPTEGGGGAAGAVLVASVVELVLVAVTVGVLVVVLVLVEALGFHQGKHQVGQRGQAVRDGVVVATVGDEPVARNPPANRDQRHVRLAWQRAQVYLLLLQTGGGNGMGRGMNPGAGESQRSQPRIPGVVLL